MNLDEMFRAVRRVMRDLQLPERDAYVTLFVHAEHPMATILYLRPPADLPTVDFADNGDGIPIHLTTEGPLTVTVQAESAVAA